MSKVLHACNCRHVNGSQADDEEDVDVKFGWQGMLCEVVIDGENERQHEEDHCDVRKILTGPDFQRNGDGNIMEDHGDDE